MKKRSLIIVLGILLIFTLIEVASVFAKQPISWSSLNKARYQVRTQFGNYYSFSYEFNKEGTCILLNETNEIICGSFIIVPADNTLTPIMNKTTILNEIPLN